MRFDRARLPALAFGFLLAGCQSATLENSVKPPPSAATAKVAVAGDGSASTQVDPSSTTASVARNANVIESYVPPQTGTILTWRNNWATLPPVISYKVAGTVTIGGREYLKLTSVAGLRDTINAFYDTSNFALKGYRDSSDKAMVTYKPVEERYRFPMKPGDSWNTEWRSFDHRSKSETAGGGRVEVLGFEMLRVPAGAFRTVKVRMPNPPGMPAGMQHHVWFSPELGVTVKEQVGNGSLNWTQILEKVQLPAG